MSTSHFNYLKYELPVRRRYQARGLTMRGRPRVRRQWPQLAGLTGAAYRAAYNRLLRSMNLFQRRDAEIAEQRGENISSLRPSAPSAPLR